MTLDELKRSLRRRPGTTEETPFGPEHLVYKVSGKIFAVIGWDEEPMTMSLKCDPERVEELRQVFRAVGPAPYFDKRHWNRVVLDGTVPEPELLAMVDDSYELVVQALPRARREELQRRTRKRSR
jgi:predicted DNA-binding protein (MmcQ/YjbR family)